jgi:hypothetical protein
MRHTTAYRYILIIAGCLLVLLTRAFENPVDLFSEATASATAKIAATMSEKGTLALILIAMFAFWTAIELVTRPAGAAHSPAREQASAMNLLNSSNIPADSDHSRDLAA